MCICTILSLKVLKTLGGRKFIDSFLYTFVYFSHFSEGTFGNSSKKQL